MVFNFIACDVDKNNVTRDYIEELERKLNIQFPDVLVDYYMHHNKAAMKEFSFWIHHLEFSVEFIIPLLYGNVCVEKILSFNQGNVYIPDTYIPLAEDIDGEDFYWDSLNGKVYYLSMGNVENPIPICDSVEQFFEILNTSCS